MLGILHVGEHDIRCSNRYGHGYLTTDQALMKSCNAALMTMGMRIGVDDFRKYMTIFNIGNRTGIDLPGEAAGLVLDADAMTITDLAANSFGQGFNTTMIQMVSAFSSIVNGGTYYQPHVVKKILDSSGATVETIQPQVMKRTVSQKTAETLRTYLYHVIAGDGVMTGTGRCGRRGRLQDRRQDRYGGEDSPDKKNYVVSFLGAAPIDNPQVVLYVVVDEPNVAETGPQHLRPGDFQQHHEGNAALHEHLSHRGSHRHTGGHCGGRCTAEELRRTAEDTAEQTTRSLSQRQAGSIDGMRINPEYAAARQCGCQHRNPWIRGSVPPDGYTGSADAARKATSRPRATEAAHEGE